MSSLAHEHHDMQAILRGFGTDWPWAMFVFGSLSDDPEQNRNFFKQLPTIPTSVAALDANRLDRIGFNSAFNVAFSFPGLSKLSIKPDVLYSFPDDFAQGMKARADVNGDEFRSAPDFWEEHWQTRSVDFWVGIYARSEEERATQYQRLAEHFQDYDRVGIRQCGADKVYRYVSDETPVWIDDKETQPEPGKVL